MFAQHNPSYYSYARGKVDSNAHACQLGGGRGWGGVGLDSKATYLMLIQLFFDQIWVKKKVSILQANRKFSYNFVLFFVDDVPKLSDLVYELKGVNWYELGVQLDVPEYILANIDEENRTEDRKLSKVLNYWLNNRYANWKVMVEALSRIGKHGLIITTIQSKYIPSTRTCIKNI